MILCPTCETLLDVSAFAPGTLVACSSCSRHLRLPTRSRRTRWRDGNWTWQSPDGSTVVHIRGKHPTLQVIDLDGGQVEVAAGEQGWIDWRSRRRKLPTAS